VRVQKGGRGPWWNAKIDWIDHHANLATLRISEPGFWEGNADTDRDEIIKSLQKQARALENLEMPRTYRKSLIPRLLKKGLEEILS